MNKIVVLTVTLLVMFNLSSNLAAEIPKELFAQEEELLLLGEEFVITATKHLKEIKKAPSIVTVITAEQIKQMGARYLSDVLRIVPGLEVIKDERGEDKIITRGIGVKKILLMIDGIPLRTVLEQTVTLNYSDYPLEHIKRIEIIRGPGSALYGTNAFLGVINLITKDADDIDGFQLSGWGGSFETQNYNLVFGKEYGDFRALLMANYYDANDSGLKIKDDKLSMAPFFDAPGNGPYENEVNDWKEITNLYWKLNYTSLEFKGGYQNRHMGDHVGLNYVPNDNAELRNYEIFGDISYRHAFNINLEVMARIYGRLQKVDNRYRLYPEDFDLWMDSDGDGNPDMPYASYPDGAGGELHYKERTTGTEVQLDYVLFKNNKLTIGGVLEYEKLYDVLVKSDIDPLTVLPLAGGLQELPDELSPTKEAQRDSWAFYLQDDWDITPELNLTLGGRYDHYEGFGSTINPRLGLVWRPISDMNLKFLYGEAFRAPSFSELHTQNNPVQEGNSDLDPEKVRTFEASVDYDFTPQVNARIGYFHTRIKDSITLGEEITETGAHKFTNKGGSKTHGVEVELRGEYNKDTCAYANYSYQNTKDDETNRKLPDVSEHKANIGVNVGLWKYLNVNTTILLRGKKPRAEGDSRDDLPGYGLVNLALIAHNFVEGLEVFGSIYNLFDKDYTDPAPSDTLPDDFPRPGRAYYAGVRYRF